MQLHQQGDSIYCIILFLYDKCLWVHVYTLEESAGSVYLVCQMEAIQSDFLSHPAETAGIFWWVDNKKNYRMSDKNRYF